ALPRHVVDLDADAVGILEQNRVVAGRELRSLFRRVNDAGPELSDHKAMDRVDTFPVTRAQAQGVQPRGGPSETHPSLLARRAPHEDAGAATDAVDDVLAPDEGLHGQEMAELLPERHAPLRVADGELDVGDPVDLDSHDGSFAAKARGGRHHRSAPHARQCGPKCLVLPTMRYSGGPYDREEGGLESLHVRGAADRHPDVRRPHGPWTADVDVAPLELVDHLQRGHARVDHEVIRNR